MIPPIFQFGVSHEFFSYTIDLNNKPENTIYLLIQYKDKSDVVYVGQSRTNLFNRLNTHIKDEDKVFNNIFAFNLKDFQYTLDEVEHALICYFQPIYNKSLKADVTQKDFLIIRHFLNSFNDYMEDNIEIEEHNDGQ